MFIFPQNNQIRINQNYALNSNNNLNNNILSDPNQNYLNLLQNNNRIVEFNNNIQTMNNTITLEIIKELKNIVNNLSEGKGIQSITKQLSNVVMMVNRSLEEQNKRMSLKLNIMNDSINNNFNQIKNNNNKNANLLNELNIKIDKVSENLNIINRQLNNNPLILNEDEESKITSITQPQIVNGNYAMHNFINY